jgi:hypothetical protein
MGRAATTITAIVVLDGQPYRIEVLKSYVPDTAPYTARCAVSRPVPAAALAPTETPAGGTVWVEHPFAPAAAGDRPKEAQADALIRLTAPRPSEAAPPPPHPPRPRRRAPSRRHPDHQNAHPRA